MKLIAHSWIVRCCWFALTIILSACTVIPGSSISTHMVPDQGKVDLSDKINVFAITPELLSKGQQALPQPQANPGLDKAVDNYSYKVGPGDVLSITVWEHPELSTAGTSRPALPNPASSLGSSSSSASTASSSLVGGQGTVVAADGTIFFPYVGVAHVEGMRLPEIRELIAKGLGHYLVNPQVDVSMSQFRSEHVYVTGEVKAAGQLPVTDVPLTLLDAINQAGGLMPSSDWNRVVVTRHGQESVYSLGQLYRYGDTSQNTLLQSGDVVFVPRSDANKVFVLGEVKQAHSVPYPMTGLTLAEALSEAGGLNEYASDASGVFVLRRSNDSRDGKLIDVYQLNMKDATALVLAESFTLKERDIVYVTAAPLARWNKVVSLLLPSLTSFYLNVQTQHLLNNQ